MCARICCLFVFVYTDQFYVLIKKPLPQYKLPCHSIFLNSMLTIILQREGWFTPICIMLEHLGYHLLMCKAQGNTMANRQDKSCQEDNLLANLLLYKAEKLSQVYLLIRLVTLQLKHVLIQDFSKIKHSQSGNLKIIFTTHHCLFFTVHWYRGYLVLHLCDIHRSGISTENCSPKHPGYDS